MSEEGLNQSMAWQFNSHPNNGLGAFCQSLRKRVSVQLRVDVRRQKLVVIVNKKKYWDLDL